MARRREAEKRQILPDPKFNDLLVARFINNLLKQGKKSIAEGIFYGALDSVGEKTKEDPIKVFKKAVENVSPHLEVKSRRVGGAISLALRQVTAATLCNGVGILV